MYYPLLKRPRASLLNAPIVIDDLEYFTHPSSDLEFTPENGQMREIASADNTEDNARKRMQRSIQCRAVTVTVKSRKLQRE